MGQPYTQTLEREIKLRVTRDFTLPQLPGERLPSRLFTSTYFDTEGYRRARGHHATLSDRSPQRRLAAQDPSWRGPIGISIHRGPHEST